jgi:hypothetical protein
VGPEPAKMGRELRNSPESARRLDPAMLAMMEIMRLHCIRGERAGAQNVEIYPGAFRCYTGRSARWRSGNAAVCKTDMSRFDSGPGLQPPASR